MAQYFFSHLFSKSAVRDLALFSVPIIFGQIGVMLISAGDMYISSMHSTLSVGAIGTATGIFNPIFLFGIGLMMGLSPSLAIERGKGVEVKKHFFSSILYAALIGFFLSIIMLIVNLFIADFGIDSKMVPLVQRYIEIIAWSFPFAFIFQAVKEFLQSFEDIFFANLISIIAVFVNLGMNYILVFGVSSFKGLGFDGLAYASFGIRIFLCIAIILYAKKYFTSFELNTSFIKETFKFSLPIAFTFFVEVMAFCLVSVLAGGMGVVISAANTIIINIASLTFMVPLSISSAVGVKVGAKYGEKDFKGASNYAFAALFMSVVFMILSATTYVLFPEEIMRLVTSDPLVISIGVAILYTVAFFQVADGVQITLAGILRGYSVTKEPFISILIGYWGIGIPFGIYLAYYQKMQVEGLWIGLALSLVFVALFLGIIFKKRLSKL